jgi:two-component system, cell cycle response regulator
VMVDLDFFKQINDVYGHPAGDSVLKFVAELLMDNCRVSDTICRFGGEEFCVLMPETQEADAASWAERIRCLLVALRIPIDKKALQITGSFGIAQYRDDSTEAEDLLKQADKALLCAKQLGRDRVVRYTAMAEAAADADLHSADNHDAVFKNMRARDAMSPLPLCPRTQDTIGEVARFFRRSGLSSIPVLESDGRMAGFVSEKDIMAVMTSPDCWQQPVANVMRTNVICYEEDTPVRMVYDFLCRVTIRSVVITKDGHPTGTISRNSLLQWFQDWVTGRTSTARAFQPRSSLERNTRDTASV